MEQELIKNNIKFEKNVHLKNFCTIKCDEKGKLVIYPKTLDELKTVLNLCVLYDQKYFVLGEGSNVVFLKNDFVFIKLSSLNQIKTEKNSLICGAGTKINELLNVAKKNGLSGLEGLCGIPASIGGATVMNARAFGCEIARCISYVKCLTSSGRLVKYTNSQCNFAYKQSIFQNSNLIIVEVKLKFTKRSPETVENLTKSYLEKRIQAQPRGFSAGCIFKNCHCTIAGKAIDCAGFGGKKFKNFEVSNKHCNFILNNGKGRGKDLKILIEKIKRKVYNEEKIKLEEEVIFVGEEK